jgi:membrane dipeptidase
LEGADVLNSVDDLRLMYRLGVRGVGVTWNLNKRWGDSCYSKGGSGLTEEGYALVEAAQRLGMVVDLANAGRKTALDALEAARRPVVISHANVNDVYRHPRNVDGGDKKGLWTTEACWGSPSSPAPSRTAPP